MGEDTNQRIGDYEIVRELGHGGMGKVYLARNVLSDRLEAMKVLLPDLAGRSEFVARFMREIKVLASLDHPNIAALRTAFTADGKFIMIMEYVEGVTLADRLESGPLSTAEALNYTDQVLAALTYAHSKHVIHRDIKPGNMMLTPQGVVKLMDFGLARSADEVGLTVTGTTMGSLDYASPEQVQSQPTDERSDLYSLGVSLYQMVTGKRMFSATSSFSIMQAQISEAPRPPIEIVPTIPSALNGIILMAVAKDPGQRFQSAEAFRNALSQVAASVGVAPAPVQPAANAAFAATQVAAAAQPAEARPGSFQPASVPPAADPGFTVTPAAQSQSHGSRNAVLAIVVVVVVAILAGAMMYRQRQRKAMLITAMETTGVPVTPDTPPPTATPADTTAAQNQAPPPTAEAVATQPPAAQPEQATSAAPAQPAAVARSTRPHGGNSYQPPPGPSAEEIQAQQQAALEQKRMLDAMETEIDHLDSRAATVESSLGALEHQLNSQGLGLRGDMVSARSNMRTDIAKAKQAMEGNDVERSRRYLDLAQREVEKLEAFLGHR